MGSAWIQRGLDTCFFPGSPVNVSFQHLCEADLHGTSPQTFRSEAFLARTWHIRMRVEQRNVGLFDARHRNPDVWLRLGETIQASLQCSKVEGSLSVMVRHGRTQCTLLQVTFDHSKMNGYQLNQLLAEKQQELVDFVKQRKVQYWQPDSRVF